MKTKEQHVEDYIDHLYGDLNEEERLMYVPDILQSKKDFEMGFYFGKPKWTSVGEKTPPEGVELLTKSPTGSIYLSSWRPGYNIFTCQEKEESSFDWQWMEIPQ